VIVGESADVVRGRMVADWLAAKELGEPGVMIAARKADVADLNDRVRELMLQEGEVRGEALSVAGREFSEGDRVMTLGTRARST
jgi:ATP-dependent exoDNAse (exonuclease V) alpha subunit